MSMRTRRPRSDQVEELGRRCIVLAGDVGDPEFCADAVSLTVEEFGKLDILVNNAAEQHPQESLLDITPEQLERTFRTNIFSYFYMAREALKYLRPGGVIINTSSVTAYRGSSHLVDYASTKAAIVGFTRSLALSLADKGFASTASRRARFGRRSFRPRLKRKRSRHSAPTFRCNGPGSPKRWRLRLCFWHPRIRRT